MEVDDDAWTLALAPLGVTAIALAARTSRQLRRASRHALQLIYQDDHVQLLALRWRSRSLCPLFRDMNGDAPRRSTGLPIFVLIQSYWWSDHHTEDGGPGQGILAERAECERQHGLNHRVSMEVRYERNEEQCLCGYERDWWTMCKQSLEGHPRGFPVADRMGRTIDRGRGDGPLVGPGADELD